MTRIIPLSLVLFLILCSQATRSYSAIDQLSICATVDGNIIDAPAIFIGTPISSHISATFEIVGSNPLDIELKSYQPLTTTINLEDSAYLSVSTQVLKFPCLEISGKRVWATFRLLDASSLRFRLAGYGNDSTGVLIPIEDAAFINDTEFQQQASNLIETLKEKTFATISKFNQMIYSTSTDTSKIQEEINNALNAAKELEEAAYNAGIFAFNAQTGKVLNPVEPIVQKNSKRLILDQLKWAMSNNYYTDLRLSYLSYDYYRSFSSVGLGMTQHSTRTALTEEMLDTAVKVYTLSNKIKDACNGLKNYVSSTVSNIMPDEATWAEYKRKAAVAVSTGSKVFLYVAGAAVAIGTFEVTGAATLGVIVLGTMTIGLTNTIFNIHDGYVEFVYDDPSMKWAPKVPIFSTIDKITGTLGIVTSGNIPEAASSILTTFYDDLANFFGKDLNYEHTPYINITPGISEIVSVNPACSNLAKAEDGAACFGNFTYLLPPGTWKDPATGEIFTINSSDLPSWLLEKLASISSISTTNNDTGQFHDLSGFWKVTAKDRQCRSYDENNNNSLVNEWVIEDGTVYQKAIKCENESCIVFQWCYFTFTPRGDNWTITEDHWDGLDGYSLEDCHWTSDTTFVCTEKKDYYESPGHHIYCTKEWEFDFLMDFPEYYTYEINEEWLNDEACK